MTTMDGFKKPFATMAKPKASSKEDLQESNDDRELSRQRAEIEAKSIRNTNKVAALLTGAEYFITDFTWPELGFNDTQYSVSEYYPELKIAIDKFYSLDDPELKFVGEKKKRLNKIGIKYAYLDPTKRLADIEPDLEDQKL
jgi:hypothetical protein